MNYTYDADNDSLYIELLESAPVQAKELDERRRVDIDKEGGARGISILDASEGVYIEDVIDAFDLDRLGLDRVDIPFRVVSTRR